MAISLAALSALSPARAAEKLMGTVCVGRVSEPTTGDRSLSNPTGGNRSWAYSVQVDDLAAQAVSAQQGTRFAQLGLGARHLVRIRSNGKLVTSFRFTFERYGEAELCLWFNPLYETWSLWPMKDAAHLCSGEAKSDNDA
jgi:hypothetical protein